jgi:hypothetical protein
VKHLRLVATVVLSTFIACTLVSTGHAQQQPAATPTPTPTPVTTTLKLTVVISRFNGDKKVGNLPFTLMVIPNGDSTSLQMSGSVATHMSTTVDKDQKSVTSWVYQSVGTRISAQAGRGANDAGQFSVNLTVDDNQLANDPSDAGNNSSGRPARMQSFTSSSRLLLRDGQTTQFVAATDKTTGEVAKVDVTMNVIK